MHAGKNYSFKLVLNWTLRDTLVFTIVATVPTVLYEIFGYKGLTIPWLPVALVGTAVAFITGFKNNASYDRLWEARKIWGAIVNSSRTWGIMARDFVTNNATDHAISDTDLKAIHTRLIYRHIGWMTALRFQLRQSRGWENQDKAYMKKFQKKYRVPELTDDLDELLSTVLSPEDKSYVMAKKNRATQIISLQSKDLKELFNKGLLDNFKHLGLEKVLEDFYDQQGMCERIKSFPYPRQFATFNQIFVWLFILLVPFGMLQEFEKLGEHSVWLTIPFSVLVSWVIHTMEKIGEVTENPFEGGINDIPMEALTRTIEIDLRDMLDEKELPEPIPAVNDVLM